MIKKILLKVKTISYREFNIKAATSNFNITNDLLENVIKLTSINPPTDVSNIATLKTLLQWPKELLFPVLDITRLAVRHQSISSQLGTLDFVNLLVDNIKIAPANQLMSIRCLANLLTHGWGRGLVESQLPVILHELNVIKKGSGNLEIGIATLLLNLSISQIELADPEICKQITESIIEFLQWSNDAEAHYRSFQAIGNLSCTPTGQITLAQINSMPACVEKILGYSSTAGNVKLSEIARDLSDLLS